MEEVVLGRIIARFTLLVSIAIWLGFTSLAKQSGTDLKSLVGRKAIVQRMPLYQSGTYTPIPNTYAGQEATIIGFRPFVMPEIALNSERLTPQQKAALKDTQNAGTLVVQFADGTKADTGLIIPSLLANYLELEEQSSVAPTGTPVTVSSAPQSDSASSRVPTRAEQHKAASAFSADANQTQPPSVDTPRTGVPKTTTERPSTSDIPTTVPNAMKGAASSSSGDWWQDSPRADKSRKISFTRTRLFFPIQPVDNSSQPLAVVLTNNAQTPFVVSPTITGNDSSDFVQSNDCGGSLGAGASCTLSVTFRPRANGTRAAVLSLDGVSDQVRLEGIGK
jgi:hypothetical protein